MNLRTILLATTLAASAHAAVDFQRDVRPVLMKRCAACHGPDEHARQANFRVDTREGATGANGGFAGIIPGKSAQSRVVARITDPKRPMPPTGPRLTSEEVDAIRQWIDSGAAYTGHWAFEAPVRPAVPDVAFAKWPRNEIDHFVLRQIEGAKLSPSPEAHRFVLGRRLALDLTGLPPDPARLEQFVRDVSSQAYERFVDELLASPRFGERWARVWLDLARYADTQGYERDPRRTIWPYRDWVIRAFNENMPFDRFTLLQIAGDLLPDAGNEELIATAFHRNTMTNSEDGSDDEEFRDAAVKERVATTGQVWMGLTVGCAQCHTHKYDPISHKEYYQLYAFFNQTEDSDKLDDRPLLDLGNGLRMPVMRELPAGERRTTRIHERGNFLNPGDPVEAGVPAAFHPLPAGVQRDRVALAQWLISPENPLTARVAVNRFWARLFGAGLVESEEDFGTQGAQPSHPELLDWLATEYVRLGWDTKALLKTIVLSATYRQSSDIRPFVLAKDPRNRLLARGARFRLDAEVVRDQALAASGLLSAKMFGPSVMPWQPDGVWMVVYNADRWQVSEGEDRYRRALYTYLRRTSPYPSLTTFDAPTGELCTVRRIRTNTPLQALVTLNDPVYMEAAQRLALRTLSEAGDSDSARLDRMFRLVLARPPLPEERDRILALHRQAAATLAADSPAQFKLAHYDESIYPGARNVALVADSRTTPATAKYTFEQPGDKWQVPGFDDSTWAEGRGVFGHLPANAPAPPNVQIGTPWNTEYLWLRFEFDAPEGVEHLRIQIRSSCEFKAYLNGVLAEGTNVDRADYYTYPVAPMAAQAVKGGRNVLAVEVRRLRDLERGQIFDIGLQGARAMQAGAATQENAARSAWVVVANTLLNLDETVTRR